MLSVGERRHEYFLAWMSGVLLQPYTVLAVKKNSVKYYIYSVKYKCLFNNERRTLLSTVYSNMSTGHSSHTTIQ